MSYFLIGMLICILTGIVLIIASVVSMVLFVGRRERLAASRLPPEAAESDVLEQRNPLPPKGGGAESGNPYQSPATESPAARRVPTSRLEIVGAILGFIILGSFLLACVGGIISALVFGWPT
jgi:hypothetical protein